MSQQTAAQAKDENVAKMGQALGEQFSALWQELAGLHSRWGEFEEMYGTKKSRIDLLNESAPAFFRFAQDALWEQTLLHLSRLTDPPYSVGNAKKTNLTLRNLPDLIDDANLKAQLLALVDDAVAKAKFCKDWRDRLLAHRDLGLALGQPSAEIPAAELKNVSDALEAMTKVMNAVEKHYKDSSTLYKAGAVNGGASAVIYRLAHAKHVLDDRSEKLKRGEWSADEYNPTDL